MAWAVEYTEAALRQLRKLDKPIARRILDFMDERVAALDDPRKAGKALRGPTHGEFWRYRLGDYRIICDIQDEKLTVLLLELGNRREVYRQVNLATVASGKNSARGDSGRAIKPWCL